MKIEELIQPYLKELVLINRSPGTIRNIKNDLNAFIRFLTSENIYKLESLDIDVLSEYQQELYFKLTQKGKPLAVGSQLRLLCAVRGFTKFLKP